MCQDGREWLWFGPCEWQLPQRQRIHVQFGELSGSQQPLCGMLLGGRQALLRRLPKRARNRDHHTDPHQHSRDGEEDAARYKDRIAFYLVLKFFPQRGEPKHHPSEWPNKTTEAHNGVCKTQPLVGWDPKSTEVLQDTVLLGSAGELQVCRGRRWSSQPSSTLNVVGCAGGIDSPQGSW